MAYMNQEKKAKIVAELKKVMPKDWKFSLAVHNHSTIVCTIKSAPIDLIAEMQARFDERATQRGEQAYQLKGNADVNHYHYKDEFSASVEIIGRILDALNLDNFDKSDIQTDYFHVGHYVDLNIGKWNKPFIHSVK